MSLLPLESHNTHLIPPALRCDITQEIRSTLEAQYSRFILGASCAGHLCPAQTKPPDSQKARWLASATLLVQFRHTGSLLSVLRMMGTS